MAISYRFGHHDGPKPMAVERATLNCDVLVTDGSSAFPEVHATTTCPPVATALTE